MSRAPLLVLALLTACAGVDGAAFGGAGSDYGAAPDDDDAVGDDDGSEPEGDDDDGGEVPFDAAEIVAADLPAHLECGEVATASVEVRNVGGATWTRDGFYKLGAVDDDDPLFLGVRVRLGEDDVVEPGATHRFDFELTAPDEAGGYTTDWRMVHEGVTWFGETATQDVEVECFDGDDDDPTEDPPDAPGPPDLGSVTWLHSDVSSWPEAATLASVSVSGGQICLDYDMADEWPVYDLGDTAVVGNPWIFIYENDQWYGATWEWLRPGQTCKSASSVAGDHIKQWPFDEASGWTPTSGTTYYFMVSGLARFSERNIEERTGLVPFVWP